MTSLSVVPAPIALFVYKRPDHLRRTLAALQANPEAERTTLYVFSDGPRNEADAPAVAQVRDIIAKIVGFVDVKVFARQRNAGLARSVIEGVTQVLRENDRVVVIEDDLVVAPFFLRYMNEGLRTYADAVKVSCIHGYVLPVTEPLPETFFLRGADCWGWATWARAWRTFEPDGAKLLAELEQRRLESEFDLDGCYPYTQMLRDQITGKNDSWAIRWHASVFLRGGLTLYPGQSLVDNIGNDASGTHCADTRQYSVQLATAPIRVDQLSPVENEAARSAYRRFLRPQRPSLSNWRAWALQLRRALTWAR
jgi:hypothetical protein